MPYGNHQKGHIYKSLLVKNIQDRNPDANIIYINKEKKKFADIRTDDDLSKYLEGKIEDDKDNYPKYVVTMDPISKPKDYDGITHLSLRQMFMSDSF